MVEEEEDVSWFIIIITVCLVGIILGLAIPCIFYCCVVWLRKRNLESMMGTTGVKAPSEMITQSTANSKVPKKNPEICKTKATLSNVQNK